MSCLTLLKPSLLIVSTFQGSFFSSCWCFSIIFSNDFWSFFSFLTSALIFLSSASLSSSSSPSFLPSSSSLSRPWASSKSLLHSAKLSSRSSPLCWNSAIFSSRVCYGRPEWGRVKRYMKKKDKTELVGVKDWNDQQVKHKRGWMLNGIRWGDNRTIEQKTIEQAHWKQMCARHKHIKKYWQNETVYRWKRCNYLKAIFCNLRTI